MSGKIPIHVFIIMPEGKQSCFSFYFFQNHVPIFSDDMTYTVRTNLSVPLGIAIAEIFFPRGSPNPTNTFRCGI